MLQHRSYIKNSNIIFWCKYACQVGNEREIQIPHWKWDIPIYIISSVMHAFWLVLTYDLLEDRHIDDVIIKTFLNSLLYKTNRFQVAVCLLSNRSQRTSKCGKNISDTIGCASCATFLFLPHFDDICDLLLNRRMATWNLFVKWTTSFFIFWLGH